MSHLPPVVVVCMIFAHACVVTVVVAVSPKDPGFISYVVSLMRPEYCVPNDLVFREGEVGKEMYFLVQGLMEVVVKIGTAEETTYGQIEEGDYFGEIAVFELVRRTASVRAIQYSTTFVLTSESLDNVTHCTYRRSFVATTLVLLIGFLSAVAISGGSSRVCVLIK